MEGRLEPSREVREEVATTRLERVPSPGRLEDEWRRLAAESGTSIFGTWEWADAWCDAYGAGHDPALHAVRNEDGTLVAVVPLCVQRRAGLRVIRFVGYGPGDELGPVHGPADLPLAARALQEALAALRWDVAALEQLPGSAGWPNLLDEPVWRREANPVLQLGGGWSSYLETRSANFRQQLRRRERALAGAGARFRAADERTLEADLDTLFALHRARWEGGATDFADHPFHRDVARRALERGWLRLWTLELDGRVVAAWHGFRVGRVVSYYQAGRDPSLARSGVGTVLLAHTIREAMQEGALEYRFGRGAEPFKGRFTSDDAGLETVVRAATVAGHAALAVGRARRAMRRLRRPAQPPLPPGSVPVP